MCISSCLLSSRKRSLNVINGIINNSLLICIQWESQSLIIQIERIDFLAVRVGVRCIHITFVQPIQQTRASMSNFLAKCESCIACFHEMDTTVHPRLGKLFNPFLQIFIL
mmetsp:Transcript_20259/g.36618  ORF Transcript_20259/g.36618 Transcript_20259/m.36618 type:complete len:110 (-) Transcript_20259:705-1034(-)